MFSVPLSLRAPILLSTPFPRTMAVWRASHTATNELELPRKKEKYAVLLEFEFGECNAHEDELQSRLLRCFAIFELWISGLEAEILGH